MTQTPKDKQATADPQISRRGRADAVGADASRAAATALLRAGFSDPTLVLRWEEIAGPELARLARPLRYSENQGGGVLTLKAEPGAALFLGHESRALCERINAYLGRPAVARLRFVQGSIHVRVQPKPPSKSGPLSPGDPAGCYRGPHLLAEALLGLARRRRTPPEGGHKTG